MFATLVGPLPRPPIPEADLAASSRPEVRAAALDELVREAIAVQEAAGLELLSDAGQRGPILPVRATSGPGWAFPSTTAAWTFAAGCTEHPVKQVLPGPYTLARRLAADGDGVGLELALAELLRAEVDALAHAGCPLIEVEEPQAMEIGDDEVERKRFAAAHRRLAEGVAGTHLALSITGGSADSAGAATIFDAPYRSYVFDLIAGPDNWHLIASAPGDRGIVCGALAAREGSDDGPEVVVWAAHYAASTRGRGMARVGLANVPDLSAVPWPVAVRKLERLGEAARIAGLEQGRELATALDPRAVSIRAAALGRSSVPRNPGG